MPQPGVELYTRNVGHGQHAGESRKAPHGNKGRSGSTQRQSIATMGGQEFIDGSKMATDGYGMAEDWQMVMEMCSLETESLRAGVRRIIHRIIKCANYQSEHHQAFAFRTSKCTTTTMHSHLIWQVRISAPYDEMCLVRKRVRMVRQKMVK